MFHQDREREGPAPVAKALERLNARLGLARADSVATLEQHWEQLFGAQLAPRCSLKSLIDTTLAIEVDDPAIAEHLRWMSSDLVAAVNDICGGDVVGEVRFSVRRPGRRP